MYSTCLHCHANLGANQSIEAFPVGKRLAFDAAKGRLWVICPACARWNLTPLEERWEAVEDCERQFRNARQRVSKGEIGLAHLRSGVQLVRIGAPLTLEMAAWRYGRVLRKRWLTRGLPATALATAAGGFQFFNVYNPEAWAPIAIGATAFVGVALHHALRTRGRLLLPDGRVARLRAARVGKASLRQSLGGGWELDYEFGGVATRLERRDATHTLRGLLAVTNSGGARERDIDSAVNLLGISASPGDFLRRFARANQRTGLTDLREFPLDMRCALEMALHDDVERRAIEGELDALLDEWKLAEEIAQIADNMLMPGAVAARVETLAQRSA